MPPMPTARHACRAVALSNGGGVIVSGGWTDGRALATTEQLTGGVWRCLAPMQVARRWHGATIHNGDHLIVAGGVAGRETSCEVMQLPDSSECTGQWTRLQGLSLPPGAPGELSLVSFAGGIIAFGKPVFSLERCRVVFRLLTRLVTGRTLRIAWEQHGCPRVSIQVAGQPRISVSQLGECAIVRFGRCVHCYLFSHNSTSALSRHAYSRPCCNSSYL